MTSIAEKNSARKFRPEYIPQAIWDKYVEKRGETGQPVSAARQAIPRGESQYRWKSSTARDEILRAQPWQYGGAAGGRKHKVVKERMRRLGRQLALYDWSGDCREIFPAV